MATVVVNLLMTCQCGNVTTLHRPDVTPMTIKKLSSREFNQDLGAAKRAARDGPVFITDRGKPAHVLLSYEQYQQLRGGQRTLAEALAMPGAADVELDLPERQAFGLRIPNLD